MLVRSAKKSETMGVNGMDCFKLVRGQSGAVVRTNLMRVTAFGALFVSSILRGRGLNGIF